MAVRSNDHNRVLDLIDNYIADTHLFPSIHEISDISDLSLSTTRRLVKDLERSKKLKLVFGRSGTVKIYLPTRMFDEIARLQKKPEWLLSYELPEKAKIASKIEADTKLLSEYNTLERLLYATGDPLEDAVCKAMEVLKFDNVSHLGYNYPDKWDMTFDFEKHKYVCDIKGKEGHADKKDIAQIHQWLQLYIDENDNVNTNNIIGLLIINAHRSMSPEERWPKKREAKPVTEKAIKYAKLSDIGIMLTTNIYIAVKRIKKGEANNTKARKTLMESIIFTLED